MSSKPKDLSGQKFGHLVPLLVVGGADGKQDGVLWLCSCDCGGFREARSSKLRKGHVLSCGCMPRGPKPQYTKEEARQRAITRALAWNRAHQELANQRVAAWRQSHPTKAGEYQRIRASRKAQQACACCSPADMAGFWANRPTGHEVDHIVPLAKGGAHCLSNLQYLSPTENRRKGIRLLAA